MEAKARAQNRPYSRKSRFTGRGKAWKTRSSGAAGTSPPTFPGVGEEDLCIYEDEGFSGGQHPPPPVSKMMKAAGEGAFSAVVCYRLDRVSRNIGDFCPG
jgi:site-specific DNA recombinase